MTTKLHVDASAIVAMILEEEGHEALLEEMIEHDGKSTSIVSAFESVMAFGRATGRRAEALDVVQEFLVQSGIAVSPTSGDLLGNLADAHVRYGKGSGHPARLNLGDCFSYATAKTEGVPLLYEGNDFARTDLA